MDWHGRVTFADSFVLFEGSVGDNRPHSHIAAQVVIGRNVRVEQDDGTTVCGDAVIVRPHTRHRLHALANGQVYLIEPTSPFGAALLARVPADPVQVFDQARERLDELLRSGPCGVIDHRLSAALGQLQAPESADRRLPDIAREVGLSPGRLRALAARELGMPLARWRRWAAIRRACLALTEGSSLADAAMVGGFADQAHFTRTTRAMLGIPPSVLSRIIA